MCKMVNTVEEELPATIQSWTQSYMVFFGHKTEVLSADVEKC